MLATHWRRFSNFVHGYQYAPWTIWIFPVLILDRERRCFRDLLIREAKGQLLFLGLPNCPKPYGCGGLRHVPCKEVAHLRFDVAAAFQFWHRFTSLRQHIGDG